MIKSSAHRRKTKVYLSFIVQKAIILCAVQDLELTQNSGMPIKASHGKGYAIFSKTRDFLRACKYGRAEVPPTKSYVVFMLVFRISDLFSFFSFFSKLFANTTAQQPLEQAPQNINILYQILCS